MELMTENQSKQRTSAVLSAKTVLTAQKATRATKVIKAIREKRAQTV